MKNERIKSLCFFIVFFISTSLSGEEKTVKELFNKNIGKDVVLLKEFTHLKDMKACKSFVVSIKKTDAYYVAAFLASLRLKKISVYLDDKFLISGSVCPQNDGWQTCNVNLKDNRTPITCYFPAGEHTITFTYETGAVPLIDEIRMGTSSDDMHIDKNDFLEWNNSLKYNSRSDDYSAKNKKSERIEEIKASLAMNMITSDGSLYKYTGYVEQPFTYTYRQEFYIYSGTYTVFTTTNPVPGITDPVMYLYSVSNPNTYSWSDDDGGGGLQSRIAASITSTGWYVLVVRAFSTDRYGTVDVKRDGSDIQKGATVAGNMYYCDPTITSGLKNYFTCDPSSTSYSKDTYLCIAQGYTLPMKGWNDDYTWCGGNFIWGWFSRIKSDVSNICWVLVSAYSASGNKACDIYLGNNMSFFPIPGLKEDDAIKSADASSEYNCISWSGGSTTLGGGFWPPDPWVPNNVWYDSRGAKQSFDNFYGNINASGVWTPRFSDAMTYVPVTDPSQSIVDLWSSTSTEPYYYTHASVRKPGDNFMHGYDWESKPAGGTRTFHPRNDLGYLYGNVVQYYKIIGTANMSLTKSNENIQGDIDAVISLSNGENAKISALLSNVPKAEALLFNSQYESWEKTWTSKELLFMSNPDAFCKSIEFNNFVQYCMKNKAASAPMLMKKCLDGEYLAGYAIGKMGLFDNAGVVMEKTRMQSPQGKITADGFFINDTEKSGWTRFIKNLLADNY